VAKPVRCWVGIAVWARDAAVASRARAGGKIRDRRMA